MVRSILRTATYFQIFQKTVRLSVCVNVYTCVCGLVCACVYRESKCECRTVKPDRMLTEANLG